MKCHICSNDEIFLKVNEAEGWYFCPFCNIFFLDPQPSDQELDYIYHISYKRRLKRLKLLLSIMSRVRANHRYKLITSWGNVSLANTMAGTLLDVGYGDGSFMDVFKKHGWDVDGIEYSKDSPMDINKNYDLIIMSHSLEHMRNPVETLQGLKHFLRKNGKIYIEVPLTPPIRLKNMVVQERNNYMLRTLNATKPNGHLFNFNPTSLRIAIENSGLRMTALTIRVWFPLGRCYWYMSVMASL